MRQYHRIIAILGSLLLFYLAASGTMIEALDLWAIGRAAPESDVTMQSINEGKFGNGDYNAVTAADFSGQTLPAGLDVPEAMARVADGLRQQRPDAAPDFVELRMVDGRLIGQGRYGKDMVAVDVASGKALAGVEVKPTYPPRSLRQTLKEWHRFWGPSVTLWRGDKPGVYIEFAAGLVLIALMFTGLKHYWALYQMRRKIKKPHPFWKAGGTWRALHRSIAVASALLLACTVLSGTMLGFESTYHTFVPRPPKHEAELVALDHVPAMAKAAVAVVAASDKDVPLRSLRLRNYYGYQQVAVVTGEEVTRQLVFNLANGAPMSLEAPHYPDSQFPFGMNVHEWVKHFHSGYLLGVPARVMTLLSGLALLYLTVSGVVIYFDMWRRRRDTGRAGFFWKG
ncbi:hypothetical protein EOE18_08070 [Novosphingobium umbonatum]|uniref:PepSY domain-containing protein n=1 Tax=Novosphingobium umbonatum TaxID=1908524 RepID=A0A437N7J2_9SPHN|nr:PepSY-associated TM helix domain-containing protein [Novosphingobium umbonatum]RVU05909.1 hypothetical protein EOE18_08070 [Novosphingobium umbonatum]